MASTSVKMRKEDKARLDRLQARIVQRTGQKVTQEELLSRLTRLAEEEFERIADEPVEVTDEQVEALMALPFDMGIVTREEDIDRILYGWDRRRDDPD